MKTSIQGFFTGTEPDPNVANSKCVYYFPEVLTQANVILAGVTTDLIIPTHFIGWLREITTLVNRFALWQRYCVFNSLFTTLDNYMNSATNLSILMVKYMTNKSTVDAEAAKFVEYNENEECFNMFRAAGRIFALLIGYTVPEDVI